MSSAAKIPEAPDNWLQKIEQALLESKELPVLEEEYVFPWAECTHVISSALDLKELKLSTTAAGWKPQEQCLLGLGEHPILLGVELPPISGSMVWALSSEDAAALTFYFLPQEGFSDPRFQEGFYRFLMLQAIQAIDHAKLFKGSSLHLLMEAMPPQEESLCVEVAIGLPQQTVYGRLICPASFMNLFKSHQALPKSSPLDTDQAKQLEVTLRMEVGSSSVSSEEWKSVRPGDFLVLDRCSYDPKIDKGSVLLILGRTPLFQGRIKPDGLKILDYAFYYEEGAVPANVEELTDEEIEETEEHLWSAESEDEKTPSALGEMVLTVEVGRVRINLEKLLQLIPGSMLDLAISPSQGVDVISNGKKIAKGELIKLGETLGIKILHVE